MKTLKLLTKELGWLIAILIIGVAEEARPQTSQGEVLGQKIVVQGLPPGFSTLSLCHQRELERLVIYEYESPEKKMIRVTGLADMLGWLNKPKAEWAKADSAVARRRANLAAAFYWSLGWQAEVVGIEILTPYRGVRVEIMEKPPAAVAPVTTHRDTLVIMYIHKDTLTVPTIVSQPTTNWEVQTGWLGWSAGAPWDLSVPYLGLVLKRDTWALVLQGGVTPWSKQDPRGNRGDALLLGAISLYPDSWCGLKIGAFAGWEFFSSGPHTDSWTMKVVGISIGPEFRWKVFDLHPSYAFSKVSSLTKPDKWRSGGMVSVGVNFK